jgi:hypothetical protein
VKHFSRGGQRGDLVLRVLALHRHPGALLRQRPADQLTKSGSEAKAREQITS